MKAVWKFPLIMNSYQTIPLPAGAQLLTVQAQHGDPMLWCLCDPNEKVCEDRVFLMAGTGHLITDQNIEYVGTFQSVGGNFVAHVFEVTAS